MARFQISWYDDETGKLLRGPEIAGLVKKEAAAVEATAKRIAPVATGGYRDSIQTVSVQGKDRVTYRVESLLPYAMKVEAKYGVLRRALKANEKG